MNLIKGKKDYIEWIVDVELCGMDEHEMMEMD